MDGLSLSLFLSLVQRNVFCTAAAAAANNAEYERNAEGDKKYRTDQILHFFLSSPFFVRFVSPPHRIKSEVLMLAGKNVIIIIEKRVKNASYDLYLQNKMVGTWKFTHAILTCVFRPSCHKHTHTHSPRANYTYSHIATIDQDHGRKCASSQQWCDCVRQTMCTRYNAHVLVHPHINGTLVQWYILSILMLQKTIFLS